MTVMEALKLENKDLLWVGGIGGMEAGLVERKQVPFRAIPAAGVHGVGLKKLPGNLWKLAKGYFASRQILKAFKPDALLFTGGYVAIPMALAARRKPMALYVPDIEPGLALKVLAYFARRIALTTESSKMYYKNQEKISVTGYPIRQDIKKWSKPEGRAYFSVEPGLPVLLFMGGSSGARSINQALLAILPELMRDYQVIHLTGHLDWEMVQKQTAGMGPRYQAFPYLHEIGAALAAADLVISRSGASTLGEYPHFSLPAILVPYPYAWRYQKTNAEYLVDRKAAILLEDERMKTDLLPTIQQVMRSPGKLESMRQAMASLTRPQAAEEIAALLYDMAEVG